MHGANPRSPWEVLVSVHDLTLVTLLGASVLLVAVIAVRLSARTGMPSLLLYLGLGLLLGETSAAAGFSDYGLTTALGYAALVVILIEGGLGTEWKTIRPAVAPAATLATVGTLASVAVVAAAAHLLFGTEWQRAVMLGAIVSSTDAAAVFSVLRNVPIPSRLRGMLEAESGFNDAPVLIIVVTVAGMIDGTNDHSIPFLFALGVFELAGGAVAGLAVGWLGKSVLNRIALPSAGLYPIAVMAFAVLAYGVSTLVHMNGFIACYICALVLGNAHLPHRQAVRGFAEGMGWLAQIGLFVMLGVVVAPGLLMEGLVEALIIGAVLLLVARPVSVLVAIPWFGYGWREMGFLSWAGLRGAVPIVLATIPAAGNTPGTQGYLETVFVLVIVFTLLQAPSLGLVARALGVVDTAPRDLELDSSPLERMGARIMQVSVGPTSQLHGVSILELRLPEGAQVSLVMRGDDATVPSPGTVLRHGDELLVVVTDAVRSATEERLRNVSHGGRLAAWETPDGVVHGQGYH